MDGLVKGLIDVALGRPAEDQDDESEPRSRDERARSTWAQVVSSGDQNAEDHSSDRSHDYKYSHRQWSSEAQGRRQGYEEESPTGHLRSLGPPQGVKKGNEDNEVVACHPSGNKPWCNKGVENGYEDNKVVACHRSSENSWSNKAQEVREASDGWETVTKKALRHPQKEMLKDYWNRYKQPASEQEYSDDIEYSSNSEPSEEELSDLSQACNRLWGLDLNRLVPGKDYQINCGEGKKVYQTEDMAAGSLFSWLSEDIFRKPTFSRFCSLLDNYNPREGFKETVTSQEEQEQAAFIEEISRTAPIKYVHRYLSCKGIVSGSFQDFKRMMAGLWFDLYGRGGTSESSSAFEHVFVGEIKHRREQEVSGFHNWLQFYLEERKGRVDYQGYIFPRRCGPIPDWETQFVTIQFEWNRVVKRVSSTLVGVSPEFEVALYTICFFVGGEDNHVQLGPYTLNIKCYHLGTKIGSVFPVADC